MTPVAADKPIPVIDFFHPPLLESPQMNPSGTRIAALVAMAGDQTGLLFVDLDDTSKPRTLRGAGNKDIYDFLWLTDDKVMFNLGADKLYAHGMFVVDARKPRDNYAIEQHSVLRTVGLPVSTPTRPILWVRSNAYDEFNPDSGVIQIDAMQDLHAHVSDVPGARGTKVDTPLSSYGIAATVVRTFPKPPDGSALFYLPDASGSLGYAVTILADTSLKLFAYVDGRWHASPADLEEIEVEAVGDQPGEIVVQGPRIDGAPRTVRRFDALTGILGDVLVSDPDYDCANIRVHRDFATRRILGVTYTARVERTVWFDAVRQRAQQMVQKIFPGQVVTLIDADKTGDRFLVRTYSDRNPPAFHALTLSKASMSLIKNSRPWIDPARMRPMQIVAFKARDGVQLEGYLTLPEGASPEKPAPLVVLPHGGPWVRDTWGWNPEVQFLASRGYAVFQPNYRGSAGYDWKFSPADQQDFRKMHEDVTDGVKGILKSGVVDPSRVAIAGASFGGYLAMCGAAFEPDLYRCAVTMAGVFDWQILLESERGDYSEVTRNRYWARRVGDPKTRADYFASIAPLRLISDVKVPIFVQHGKEDNVVAIEQSKRLVAELKKHDVPHTVRFDRAEGHGNRRVENRVGLYAQIEAFLAEHLAPRSAPSAP